MSKELARKILENGDLFRGDDYSLKDLFRIRDALYILDIYNLTDIELLKEVERFIQQKTDRLYCI